MSVEQLKYNFSDDQTGVHRLILDRIPPNSRVLDVGCATGYLGQRLVLSGCEVWGIEPDKTSYEHALNKGYKNIINLSVEAALESDIIKNEKFDRIIVADVLEHLVNPILVLNSLKIHSKPDGKILVSLPNIAHYSIRLALLFGKFDMVDTGILDKTHLHFYTLKAMYKLLEDGGWKIEEVRPRGDLERWFRKIGLEKVGKFFQFIFQKIFAYQFIIIARPL
ncbi:MAG: class I SAM-dependent methyltransferase [Patescibacteria group bacterium]|jgi:methionine biosynthesis protein MetW